MSITKQIAKHFRDVHFGGNWTWSNMKDNLAGVTWQEATTKVYSFNTIATLVFHINYFVEAAMKVLEGKPLDSKDEYSFNHPPINSQADWENMLNKTWVDAEKFTKLVEQLPDSKLLEIFEQEKYGTYYRNLNGIIEHTHYHLGQIALIKKIIAAEKANM
jgi:uncharacterized damage-inducible protein DinB